MSWRYNPETQRTEPRPNGLIARTVLEDAIERLMDAGIRNRNEIADCLAALSGLSFGEVAFTVNLVCDARDGNILRRRMAEKRRRRTLVRT